MENLIFIYRSDGLKKTKRLCILAIFVALAFCLSYLESLLPLINLRVPGLKIGFANIIVLLTLCRFGWKAAAAVSFLRILLSFFFFGNVTSFIFSLSGAFLSLLIMAVFVKWNLFSEIGVSVLGSVFHIVGQLVAATLILKTESLWVYFSYLLPVAVISGALIGLIVRILNKRLKIGAENKKARKG